MGPVSRSSAKSEGPDSIIPEARQRLLQGALHKEPCPLQALEVVFKRAERLPWPAIRGALIALRSSCSGDRVSKFIPGVPVMAMDVSDLDAVSAEEHESPHCFGEVRLTVPSLQPRSATACRYVVGVNGQIHLEVRLQVP